MRNQYEALANALKSLHATVTGVPVPRPRWEYGWAFVNDMSKMGAEGWRAVPGSYNTGNSYHLMERAL